MRDDISLSVFSRVGDSNYGFPKSVSEKDIISKILGVLEKSAGSDIEEGLVKSLSRLNDRDQFHVQLIDRSSPRNRELRYAYGYYSAYDNNIYLVTDETNFGKKWFGLASDFSEIRIDEMHNFASTCLHELMHYACTNFFEAFNKIWRNTIKSYAWALFQGIVNTAFFDFADRSVFSSVGSREFLMSPDFRRAFDAYYTSVTINTRFRLKSITKRYSDILSTLYSKHSFAYARFFDNILVNAIKLQEGNFSKASMKLYSCLRNTYYVIEPSLADVKIKSLHYQEIFDFSEIVCVLATHYDKLVKNKGNILDTLSLF